MKVVKQIEYLEHLTTSFGIVQHARGAKPDFSHGYSLDDNARALLAVLCLADKLQEKKLTPLVKRYFKFIKRAQTKDGWFINFFDHKGQPLEKRGSIDAFSRAIFALSELSVNQYDSSLRLNAQKLLKKSLPHVETITNPHGLAFLLLAAAARDDKKQTKQLADQIVKLFVEQATREWQWFEPVLTHANAVMPWALAQAAIVNNSKKILKIGEISFDFLDRICRLNGKPAPIGNKGWYPKEGKRAIYDQQPVDVADMILAATALYRATKKIKYLNTSLDWFGWFYGNNIKKVVMLDRKSGGIYDGLTREGINPNQGAENIVLYLLIYGTLKTAASQSQPHFRAFQKLVGE